jgi:predicted nucleic acid-binding protein
MSDERFTLDTNILVYSVDGKAGRRHQIASQIVESAARCDCWITLQAVSGFYAVVARKHLVSRSRASDSKCIEFGIFG